jgi:hypothetical protein
MIRYGEPVNRSGSHRTLRETLRIKLLHSLTSNFANRAFIQSHRSASGYINASHITIVKLVPCHPLHISLGGEGREPKYIRLSALLGFHSGKASIVIRLYSRHQKTSRQPYQHYHTLLCNFRLRNHPGVIFKMAANEIGVSSFEIALDLFFSPPRAKYTDEDFERITSLLRRTTLQKYAKTPRLYTLLRHLNCINDLDYFIVNGLSDWSLPFSQTQLPSAFSEGWKCRFRDAQHIVCEDSTIVQMMSGKHFNFNQTQKYFQKERNIGGGRRSVVDEVSCIIGGGQVYARKQFLRSRMPVDDASTMTLFENEVQIMKRIVHHHCVQLVSYRDYQHRSLRSF